MNLLSQTNYCGHSFRNPCPSLFCCISNIFTAFNMTQIGTRKAKSNKLKTNFDNSQHGPKSGLEEQVCEGNRHRTCQQDSKRFPRGRMACVRFTRYNQLSRLLLGNSRSSSHWQRERNYKSDRNNIFNGLWGIAMFLEESDHRLNRDGQ